MPHFPLRSLRRRDAARLLALAAVAPLLPGVQAQSQPRLRGFTENLAPLNYTDEGSGAARGFSVELLRLIADEAGLPHDIEVMPWQRAVQSAAHRRDRLLFSLTRTPERETRYQWLGPISPRRILVYRLSRRSDVNPESLHRLNGLKLGVVRDSAPATPLLAEGLRPEL